MPIIPRYKGYVELPSQGPEVRGSMEVAGISGQATAGFGEAVSQAGDVLMARAAKIKEQDDKNYITKKVNSFEDAVLQPTENELSLRGEDALGGSERMSASLNKLIEETIKDVPPHLQDELKTRLDVRKRDRINQILSHEVGQRAVYNAQLDKETIETYAKNAYRFPDQLAKSLGYAKNELGSKYTPEVRSSIIAAGVEGILIQNPKNPELAKEYFGIVSNDMTVEDQIKYEKKINGAIDAAIKQNELDKKKLKADQKELEKKWHEEDTQKAGELYGNKALTIGFVNKMRVNDKAKWYDRAEKQFKETEKEKAGDAEASMRRRINVKPDSIESKDEIWDLIDKGVSPKIVKSMVADWEDKKGGEKPSRDARQARIHTTLSAAKGAGLFDDPEIKDPKNAWIKTEETWRDLARQTDAFFKENPQATDRDVQGFEEQLLGPYRQRDAESRIKKILNWVLEQPSDLVSTISKKISSKPKEKTEEQPTKQPENTEDVPEEKQQPQQGVDVAKREQAIKLLRDNKKLVNEETIKMVMDRMK